jgi:hypothetical protein
VPRDRLALAIGVGREEDVLGLLRRTLDVREDLRLPLMTSYAGVKPPSMSTPIFDFGRSFT